MALIYKTKKFMVESAEQPLIARTDGGHIVIDPVKRIIDRTFLSPVLAIELMYLTMLTGEAMQTGLTNRGIDIGRINYQDNGNWGVFKSEGPYLHIHLYGRAKSAKIQKYGEACYFPLPETGFYNGVEPLNDEDVSEIKKQIARLLLQSKYKYSNWGLKNEV
ncbi:MAG TPA: hypothetical protein VI461_12025 [Chitinophagaceae bacterium]|nr:hypothetical protein [Chitinophagaceae bacterium]